MFRAGFLRREGEAPEAEKKNGEGCAQAEGRTRATASKWEVRRRLGGGGHGATPGQLLHVVATEVWEAAGELGSGVCRTLAM